MSEKQHQEDDKFLKHVSAGGVEGGHCLNRHLSHRAENSCSHMWQAYKKMLDKPRLYNNKADGVAGGIQCFLRPTEKGESAVEWKPAKKPAKDAWNVGGSHPGNFTKHCNVPYYHEAHHIVPNSTLNGTISDLFGENKKTLRWFRAGLLDEGYNLNHKTNMIMLPNDRKVGAALDLPCHRRITKDSTYRSHNVYSATVKDQLVGALSANIEEADKHDDPNYKACKSDIESLSGTLFDEIVAAGKDGIVDLDAMFA